MDGIAIRPWEQRDREAVQSLLGLLSAEAEVRSEDAPTSVAESGGRVVGMVTLCVFRTLTGSKAYLDHLVVAPDRRRQGIGRALARHATERARGGRARAGGAGGGGGGGGRGAPPPPPGGGGGKGGGGVRSTSRSDSNAG